MGFSFVSHNRLGNHLKGLENKMKSSSGSSVSSGSAKDSSKVSTKGKGNGTVSRGANERSSRSTRTAASKGGEGVMASGDSGDGGRVGSSEGKSKASGSKVRLLFPGWTLLLSSRKVEAKGFVLYFVLLVFFLPVVIFLGGLIFSPRVQKQETKLLGAAMPPELVLT